MDPIREAFLKAKQDVESLRSQVSLLSDEIRQLRAMIQSQQTDKPIDQHIGSIQQTDTSLIPADNLSNIQKQALYGLKSSNKMTSTGNRGVPADRQTNQQTDQHIPLSTIQTDPKELKQLINSLDNVKSEVRLTLKSLTKQELLVFLTIYQLEEESLPVDYTILAQRLTLTESSIRDYVQKIIKKGIPIQKSKENNKKVYILVLPEFKKLLSLPSLMSFFELKQS